MGINVARQEPGATEKPGKVRSLINNAAKRLMLGLELSTLPTETLEMEQIQKLFPAQQELVNKKIYTFREAGDINESSYIMLNIHGLVGDGENFILQLSDPRFKSLYQYAPDRFMDITRLRGHTLNRNDEKDIDPIDEIIDIYFVNLIENRIKKRPSKKIILNTQSLGSEIGYRLAARYPDHILCIALAGASGLKSENFLSGNLYSITKSPDVRKQVTEDHFVDKEMVPNNLANKITRLISETDLKAQLIKLAKKGKHPDVEKNIECLKTLKENNIPVMLFHGKRDTIMTIDTLQEFQRILETPTKNVAIFDAHHMPGMDGSYDIHNEELFEFIVRSVLQKR